MIERLDFAFKSQKEFTANASHELKTPLTRISFQIEGMLENYKHESEVFNYLTNIKSEVHQMSSLINTLLLLSKIENGERSVDFETLRIDELIFSGFEELKKLDQSYDLQFEIIEGEELEIEMELNGIKPLIQIAVNNLLKNAFQYSSDGIAVVKIVSKESGKLLVIIENNGPIITDMEQTKLFGSFIRGANSQNTKHKRLWIRT
jgi:two-component system, OmpR family, sensor histidine kinase ArlS